MEKVEIFENPPETGELSLEQRGGIIEKIGKKFPKLKPLIFAFATSIVTFSEPEFASAQEAQKTHVASKSAETADEALQKLSDIDFLSFIDNVSKIRAEIALVGREIPENVIYANIREYEAIDRGTTFREDNKGTLPESAESIMICIEFAHGDSIKAVYPDGKEFVHTAGGTKSAFYVRHAEGGKFTEGGKFEVQGRGATKGDALQNALESTSLFLGGDISTRDELSDKKLDDAEGTYSESGMVSVLTTKTEHYIKSYRIIEYKEVFSDEGEITCMVTVEVVGGSMLGR